MRVIGKHKTSLSNLKSCRLVLKIKKEKVKEQLGQISVPENGR